MSFNAWLLFLVQYAIVFKTPKYKEEFISRPVIVSMQLYRPSDGEGSDPIQFTYMPEDPGLLIAYTEGWVGFMYMPEDPPVCVCVYVWVCMLSVLCVCVCVFVCILCVCMRSVCVCVCVCVISSQWPLCNYKAFGHVRV